MSQNVTLSNGIKLVSLWYVASGLTGFSYLVEAAISPNSGFNWSALALYGPMLIIGFLIWWFEQPILRILSRDSDSSPAAEVGPLRIGIIILSFYFLVNSLTKLGYVVPLQIAQRASGFGGDGLASQTTAQLSQGIVEAVIALAMIIYNDTLAALVAKKN